MSYFPNAAIQTIGAAIPPAAELMGGSDGTDIRALLVSVTGQLHTLVDNFPATQPVSGTVAVTQSTSPWVVSGTVTTTPPANASTNITQISGAAITEGQKTMANSFPVVIASDQSAITVTGTVIVNQGTSPWVVSLASTTITGTVAENLTQWAGTTLGTPTNFGMTPGAVVAGSVNASLFAGTTQLSSSGSALNVNVSNLTVAVVGTLTNNNAAPTNNTQLGVLPAIANTSAPTWTNGDQVLLSEDTAGNLRTIDVNGNLLQSSSTSGQHGTLVFGAATTSAPIRTSGQSGPLSLDTSGLLRVSLEDTPSNVNPFVVTGSQINNNTPPGIINLGVLPAIANAVSPSWTEGNQVLESVDLTGRQRVRGTLTHNNAAPDADLIGVMNGLANAVAPTYTEGDLVLQSVDLSGNTRIIGTKANNTAAPTTEVAVIPAVANAVAPIVTEGNQVLLSTTLNSALRVVQQPQTTGGLPLPFSASVNATKQQVKATAGLVYGWQILNNTAAIAYVQVFNLASASVTVGTTVPDYVIPLPGNSTTGAGATINIPIGITHSVGITIACTTTRGGNTGATCDVVMLFN